MTVWAVHEVGDDVSSAGQWGNIRYVNHRYVNGDDLDGDRMPRAFYYNLAQAVVKFNHLNDYVLIVGDHLQVVQFSAMLATQYPAFNVLRWDRREKAYFPVRIDCSVPA